MPYTVKAIRIIALDYLALRYEERVMNFNEYCTRRGDFLKTDYVRIKAEIKRIQTSNKKRRVSLNFKEESKDEQQKNKLHAATKFYIEVFTTEAVSELADIQADLHI